MGSGKRHRIQGAPSVRSESETLARYRSLEQRKYPFLERFELTRTVESSRCSDYVLTLVLGQALPTAGGRHLRLVFTGVRDLHLGRLEGFCHLQIEVRSVRDHQLEDLRYRVVEEEEQSFAFYCHDLAVAEIEADPADE